MRNQTAFQKASVEQEDFFFGVKRNDLWQVPGAFTDGERAPGAQMERTNKNESIHNADFLTKSRLGFKHRSLGQYRTDAPTASHLAESLCLGVCSYMQFILLRTSRTPTFQGRKQPRGGLPGLSPAQLLRAKKAIYNFSEAARLFWLALKELISDGWKESRLEPALGQLRAEHEEASHLQGNQEAVGGEAHGRGEEATGEFGRRAELDRAAAAVRSGL